MSSVARCAADGRLLVVLRPMNGFTKVLSPTRRVPPAMSNAVLSALHIMFILAIDHPPKMRLSAAHQVTGLVDDTRFAQFHDKYLAPCVVNFFISCSGGRLPSDSTSLMQLRSMVRNPQVHRGCAPAFVRPRAIDVSLHDTAVCVDTLDIVFSRSSRNFRSISLRWRHVVSDFISPSKSKPQTWR